MSATEFSETSELIETWTNGRTHRATLVIREAGDEYSYCVVFGGHQYWSHGVYTADELPTLRMMAWTDLRSICQRPAPSL